MIINTTQYANPLSPTRGPDSQSGRRYVLPRVCGSCECVRVCVCVQRKLDKCAVVPSSPVCLCHTSIHHRHPHESNSHIEINTRPGAKSHRVRHLFHHQGRGSPYTNTLTHTLQRPALQKPASRTKDWNMQTKRNVQRGGSSRPSHLISTSAHPDVSAAAAARCEEMRAGELLQSNSSGRHQRRWRQRLLLLQRRLSSIFVQCTRMGHNRQRHRRAA